MTTATRDTGFWRYENRMIAVLCLMFGVVFFDRNAMSNLAVFVQRDLALSNFQVSLLVSGLSLAWAIAALLIGAISDKTGSRKGLLVFTVLMFSACSFLSGIAAGFVMLLASRVLMGFAEGGILPIAQSLVALESDEKRRGLNMGVMQNLGSNLIGSFLAPIILTAIALAWGWRSAFFTAAVPGFICAALIWFFVREPKAHEIASRTTAAPSGEKMGFLSMLRFRNIWLCALMSILMVPWMIIGWVFLSLYLINVQGVSESSAAGIVSVLGISAAVFAFIVPGLSDKLGRKPVIVGFTLLGALYPVFALYFHGPLWALGALIFFAWSASGVFPLFMATIPSETIPSRYMATSLGLVMGLGELVGGSSLVPLAGKAADLYGLHAPLWIASALALASTVFALFLVETAPAKVGSATLAAARAA
jgi:ACS family hexuronate transporter-like MFS transporter